MILQGNYRNYVVFNTDPNSASLATYSKSLRWHKVKFGHCFLSSAFYSSFVL